MTKYSDQYEEELPLHLSADVQLPDGLAEGAQIHFKNNLFSIVETGDIIRLESASGLRSALGLEKFLDHYAEGSIVKHSDAA